MDDPIAKELRAAQAAYLRAPKRRAAAVIAAKENAWPIYRIAKTLGVDQSTVRAILKAAEKNGEQ